MRNHLIICLLAICLGLFSRAARADYDPLAVSGDKPAQVDMTVRDEKRERDIPIRIYLPASKSAAPIVLFSHGLGGTREGSAFLGVHWAQRGYVAVFLQHPGSDDSVWREQPMRERLSAMKKAANLENFQLRVNDVPAVLDQLSKWNGESSHALGGRLDMNKVGMSGHSFGAVTTQAVSGQSFLRGNGMTESRIKAALPMSPSVPQRGKAEDAFGSVKIPWLLMTGTRDESIIGNSKPEDRMKVFPALPAGPPTKYELVLNNAEHSAFTERALPGESQQRNPNHHRVILALSTAFWDAYLRGDEGAKAWLDGAGPRAVMEKEDRWQKK